jgi:hypothetical protein
MKRPYKFDPLSIESFRERVQQNFVQSCMTMMSIIQGLSFSFLMVNAMQNFGPGDGARLRPSFLIYPAISFFIMVLVLFFYSWFISITYRPPSIRETLVPFLLGLLQVIPTYYFDVPSSWFFLNGWLMVMGGLGFFNTLIGTSERDFGDDFVVAYVATRKELCINIVICLLCAIVCFLAWGSYPSGGEFSAHDWLPCALIFAILLALGLRSERSYLQSLYRIYDLR